MAADLYTAAFAIHPSLADDLAMAMEALPPARRGFFSGLLQPMQQALAGWLKEQLL